MSDKRNDGFPAFPTDSERQNGPNSWHYEGMSLRAWFAGQALAGIKTNPELCRVCDAGAQRLSIPQADAVAMMAVKDADALIAELAKDRPATKEIDNA